VRASRRRLHRVFALRGFDDRAPASKAATTHFANYHAYARGSSNPAYKARPQHEPRTTTDRGGFVRADDLGSVMRARRGPTRLDFICDAIQRFESGATEHEIRVHLVEIDVGPPLTNPRSPLLRHLLNQYARRSWGRDLWTKNSDGRYLLTDSGRRHARKVSRDIRQASEFSALSPVGTRPERGSGDD
jgi:hypothetical protein